MAKRAGGDTLAVSLHANLRGNILQGQLPPGARLMPAALAKDHGVSLGVAREALNMLAAQGLVQVAHNRGVTVTELSGTALENLTFARKLNEGAALRLSLRRGEVAWESEVLAAHHRMAGQPMMVESPSSDRPARGEAWAVAHLDYHRALISACGNPVLLDICARLSDAAELYRAWSSKGTKELGRDVAGEHLALLEAALAHDEELAVEIFEQHVDRTRDLLLNTMQPSCE